MMKSQRMAADRANAEVWEENLLPGECVHVFRVPFGWSIEQAWEYIRDGKNYPHAPKATNGWVCVVADEERRMIRVLS